MDDNGSLWGGVVWVSLPSLVVDLESSRFGSLSNEESTLRSSSLSRSNGRCVASSSLVHAQEYDDAMPLFKGSWLLLSSLMSRRILL